MRTPFTLVTFALLQSLRVLDPTGVLFEVTSPVVKQYLRGRKDTIRCIITSLTEDTQSELFAELMKRGGSQAGKAATKWFPDPIDADPAVVVCAASLYCSAYIPRGT
jgi:anaphase-promoting complex subunit 2